jgi:hypothetical protein
MACALSLPTRSYQIEVPKKGTLTQSDYKNSAFAAIAERDSDGKPTSAPIRRARSSRRRWYLRLNDILTGSFVAISNTLTIQPCSILNLASGGN